MKKGLIYGGAAAFLLIAGSFVLIREFLFAYASLFLGTVFIIGSVVQTSGSPSRSRSMLNILLISFFVLGIFSTIIFQVQTEGSLPGASEVLSGMEIPGLQKVAQAIINAVLDLIGFDRDTFYFMLP